MTGGEVQWLIGAAVAFVGLIGGIIARDRYVMGLISKGDEANTRQTREEADKLHERVNRVRDEYVRRVDLDGHIMRLDASVKSLGDEMRQNAQSTNQRLDALLSHLVKDKRD